MKHGYYYLKVLENLPSDLRRKEQKVWKQSAETEINNWDEHKQKSVMCYVQKTGERPQKHFWDLRCCLSLHRTRGLEGQNCFMKLQGTFNITQKLSYDLFPFAQAGKALQVSAMIQMASGVAPVSVRPGAVDNLEVLICTWCWFYRWEEWKTYGIMDISTKTSNNYSPGG